VSSTYTICPCEKYEIDNSFNSFRVSYVRNKPPTSYGDLTDRERVLIGLDLLYEELNEEYGKE
jgi:hypothetical protein